MALNVTTRDERGWFFFLEWIAEPVSGNRCYIQMASNDGLERHELLCLAAQAEANDFVGRVEQGAHFYVALDPLAKNFPYIVEIIGERAKFLICEDDRGVRAKGKFGVLDFDFNVLIGSERLAFGEISNGTPPRAVVRGEVWASDRYQSESVVTTKRCGLLIPSLGIWLDEKDCSGMRHSQESWTSGLTFERYPVNIHVDNTDVSIDIRALRVGSESEFLYLSCPRWIGWCNVIGEVDGSFVNTTGLFICPGAPLSPIDGFLRKVSSIAYQALDRMLPLNAETTTIHALFGAREYVDLDVENFPTQCAPPVLEPITTILERGGQAWRGVTLGLCCQAVGGEFDATSEWLIFAEMLHTGALIVDDVQDDTPVRRGGPACHEIYGRATAVNSGTLAYFMVQQIIERSTLSDCQKAAVYGEYLDLLRVTHIGQGIDHQLDIEQLSDEPTDAELQDMRQQVYYCDLFKSGMPFRSYARIGGLLGNATEMQLSSLGRFFLCLGIAFQAIDDVISITGHGDRDLKRGDDLRRGRITLPILLALGSLHGIDRERLCRTIKSAKNDNVAAIKVADKICAMDVLQACRDTAIDATEAAYRDLQQTFSSSVGMHLIQEFAVCTLQRHY
jgi:geranylgeranyl pyrophosphate synthase